MKTNSLLLFVVLTLSALAVAQHNQPMRDGTTSTTTCTHTFGSGTGANATQFCVTDNGNITQFSRPANIEYINNGFAGEGYGVCDYDRGVAYYDYAGDGDTGWGPPTLLSSNPVKISRTTTDGNFTLTQTIANVNASNRGPGAATVTMALINNSGSDRQNVYIMRYANIDIQPNSTTNEFDYTLDTAYGMALSGDNFSRYGLASTNNTFTYGWDAGVLNTNHGPSPCTYSFTVPPTPFVGDGSILQVWSYALPKARTKTVVMTYKPI